MARAGIALRNSPASSTFMRLIRPFPASYCHPHMFDASPGAPKRTKLSVPVRELWGILALFPLEPGGLKASSNMERRMCTGFSKTTSQFTALLLLGVGPILDVPMLS